MLSVFHGTNVSWVISYFDTHLNIFHCLMFNSDAKSANKSRNPILLVLFDLLVIGSTEDVIVKFVIWFLF